MIKLRMLAVLNGLLIVLCSIQARGEVDLPQIVARGVSTSQRLAKEPASWTVRNTLGSGAVITISMLRDRDRQRAIFHVKDGQRQFQFLKIIQREGVWYVSDNRGHHRYRPFEYPAETPFVYLCLQRTEPVYLAPDTGVRKTKLETIEQGVATIREPASPQWIRQATALLAQLEKGRNGGLLNAPDEQTVQLLNETLEGKLLQVDTTTGQVIEFGTPKIQTQISDFQFLERVDESAFAVGDHQWQDQLHDPTVGNLDDLMMIGHDSRVKPGSKIYDLDGRILDVKTGRFWRIPFRGGLAVPGCFLKDRRYVVACGTDLDTGSVRPYKIDLKTGRNERLGGPELDLHVTIMCDLSPDGRTLLTSAIRLGAPRASQVQLFTVDLESGKTQPLGEPMDTGPVQWTADGQHVLLIHRQARDGVPRAVTTLATMDLDGRVTKLRAGDSPVLLADRRTILFTDRSDDLMYTCDLQGQNVKRYADGMKGYGFAAPSPDGKRIFMMRFSPGELPKPVVLPLGESKGHVVTEAAGLWGMPSWR